jgi:hypothetical protein
MPINFKSNKKQPICKNLNFTVKLNTNDKNLENIY